MFDPEAAPRERRLAELEEGIRTRDARISQLEGARDVLLDVVAKGRQATDAEHRGGRPTVGQRESEAPGARRPTHLLLNG